jgi:hypothetical protein
MSSKGQISNKSLHFSKNVFKKARDFYNGLTLLIKSLHFSENVFKKPRHLWKSLAIFEKASHSLKTCVACPQEYFQFTICMGTLEGLQKSIFSSSKVKKQPKILQAQPKIIKKNYRNIKSTNQNENFPKKSMFSILKVHM